jgi:hypothetical protein
MPAWAMLKGDWWAPTHTVCRLFKPSLQGVVRPSITCQSLIHQRGPLRPVFPRLADCPQLQVQGFSTGKGALVGRCPSRPSWQNCVTKFDLQVHYAMTAAAVCCTQLPAWLPACSPAAMCSAVRLS